MELLRCRWCGAPYAYRENLEVHEKSCPKRLATQPVSRYILPVELQREWIKNRESLWAEGKRLYEWSAGLYLENGRITDRDYAIGHEERKSPWVELRKDLRPIGTVHSHPTMTGPYWDDMVNWVYLAIKQIPEDLRPLFIVTLPDDTFFAYMLPPPRTARVFVEMASAEARHIEEKVKSWKLQEYECVLIDAHYGMLHAGETNVWRRPKLGLVEQYFYAV